MKTTFYLAIVLVISFIVITPDIPKEYPPKKVRKQRESIVFKEIEIDHLIDKIEYQIKKDSIEIKSIKNDNTSKTN